MIGVTPLRPVVNAPPVGHPPFFLKRTAAPFSPIDDPTQNLLLASLDDEQRGEWMGELELVEMTARQVLYESGEHRRFAYFPTTAIVSVQHTLSDGETAEVALIGYDGMVGASLVMDIESAASRTVVQTPGRGWRAPLRWLQQEYLRGGPALFTLLRYSQSLTTQIGQTALCNRHHSVRQQLCRCLLRQQDLVRADDLSITHDVLSRALGVRREGITDAACELGRAGVIGQSRGRIRVLDRMGLEQRSCECYSAALAEQRKLLHRAWGDAALTTPARQGAVGAQL